MFSQWFENLKLFVGDESDLPALDELKRMFEGGYSEVEAWSICTNECVFAE